MYTVKLLVKAETELTKSCEWYEDKLAGLGAEFLNAIDGKLSLIEKNPFHYNVRFSEKYRFAPLTDYPYVTVYRIDNHREQVL